MICPGVIAVFLIPRAFAGSVTESDPTGCVDEEELEIELDAPWLPDDADVWVGTSVIAGAFGIDVRVDLAHETVWEKRIPVRRADCLSAAETVALSVRQGIRDALEDEPDPLPRATDLVFALTGTVGWAGPPAPRFGVRAGALRPVAGPIVAELTLGVAEGLPVALEPSGSAQVVEGTVALSAGPEVYVRNIVLLPVVSVAGGIGVVRGAGLFQPDRTVVPRCLPGAGLLVEVAGVHVGVRAFVALPRLVYEVGGGVRGLPTREPLFRAGFELGARSVGKVPATNGTPP